MQVVAGQRSRSKGSKRRVEGRNRRGLQAAVLGLAMLGGLAGCAGGSKQRFAKGEEPQVEFFQLTVAKRVQRLTDPREAVQAFLKITNRSDAPIELYRARLTLDGNIQARVERDRELLSQAIPAQDARIVRVKMTLLNVERVSTSTSPLIPTLRGQLAFRTVGRESSVSVNEKLTEVGEYDGTEDEETE